MPAILSENLDMGAFFMREKLKQFYIVLLVFILTIMGQYGHVLQTEAVFSTQKETVSAKSEEESVKELARMLGGVKITEAVLQNAREMRALAKQ